MSSDESSPALDAESSDEHAAAKGAESSDEHASSELTASAEHASVELHSWGAPFAYLESRLTQFEQRLLLAVLLAEMGSLLCWVVLRGLALDTSDPRGGIVRTALAWGLGVGLGALVRRKLDASSWAYKLLPGALGVALAAVGWMSRGVGVKYCENLLNWLQNGSALLLVGGLRGLVTRLTMWLALLGASLATGKGKHINIDVVMRFAPLRARLPLALLGWLTAAVVCVTAAWGFFDQIALGEFRVERTEDCGPAQADGQAAQCEVGAGKKIAGVAVQMRRDLFLLGRQFSLDLRSAPKVLLGETYNEWLSPKEWNDWMRSGAWEKYYPAEAVAAQMLDESLTEPRLPAVVVPGGEENPSGILVREMNLLIPFCLLVIALRFVLRSLLALSGDVVVDPNAAHAEDDDEPSEDDNDALMEGGR